MTDIPFWIWDPVKHQHTYEKSWNSDIERCTCCFWHTVGLPVKEHLIGRKSPTKNHPEGEPILYEKAHPLYPYEKPIIDNLMDLIPTASLKATGMGVTTMTLGFMAWQTLESDKLYKDTLGVVTGPRVNLAVEEIERIPELFDPIKDVYQPKVVGTELEINHCKIHAYPSHTFDAARGLDRVRGFFMDESDFFPIGQQVSARHVVERYIAKTHPWSLLNSTPNAPGGMMDTIWHEENSIYRKIELPYTVGLKYGIYSKYEIEEAMKSPSFQREYNLRFGVGIGNIFNQALVDRSLAQYPKGPQGGIRVLNLDPAFGESETASKYGIVGGEKRGDIVYVTHAEQRARPSPDVMMDYVHQVYYEGKYHVLRIDSAWSGIIRDFAAGNPKTGRRPINADAVVFSEKLEPMTAQAPLAIQNDQVRIDPAYTDLIAQLKAIEYKKNRGIPDKDKISFDIGDAFLMLIEYFFGDTVGGAKMKGEF